MSKDGNDGYAVGYRKPPASRRWKPGQSGNPAGRKKGSKNRPTTMAEAIAEELAKPVPITIDGKQHLIDGNRYIAMKFARMLYGAKELADLKRGAQIVQMIDLDSAQQKLKEEFEYRAAEESRVNPFTERDRRLLDWKRRAIEGDDDDYSESEYFSERDRRLLDMERQVLAEDDDDVVDGDDSDGSEGGSGETGDDEPDPDDTPA